MGGEPVAVIWKQKPVRVCGKKLKGLGLPRQLLEGLPFLAFDYAARSVVYIRRPGDLIDLAVNLVSNLLPVLPLPFARCKLV